jgi:ubiquinone/menaquinone biosynthesis C-methylase UbiE
VSSPEYIREVQYRTDSNLAARQSIYVFQHPRVRLYERALDLAELRGDEVVFDIGCGNGAYLATLSRRGHRGVVVGGDMSVGMLEAARPWAGAANLIVADAQRIPFSDDTFDVTLAMHMLYHVPDRALGIAELRRVTRPGGVALVVTNSVGHLAELDDVLFAVTGVSLPSSKLVFNMENAGAELESAFEAVTRHDFPSKLEITEVQPVLDYVASMRAFVAGTDIEVEPALAELGARVATIIERDGAFVARTGAGCFVCR